MSSMATPSTVAACTGALARDAIGAERDEAAADADTDADIEARAKEPLLALR